MNIPVVTENMIKAAEAVDDLYRMGQPQLWARVFRAMYAAMPVSAEAATPVGYAAMADTDCFAYVNPDKQVIQDWIDERRSVDGVSYFLAPLYTTSIPTIPNGWKLIPIEMTREMVNAHAPYGSDDIRRIKHDWSVSLQNAPNPPFVAAPQASQPIGQLTRPPSKNWNEDAEHENGNYQNTCAQCNGLFIGNKSRVICAQCAFDSQPVVSKATVVPEVAVNVPNWQPIETAPTDGSLMLLATEFDGPGDWRIKIGGYWDDEWNVFGGSWMPTMWAPMPATPNAAAPAPVVAKLPQPVQTEAQQSEKDAELPAVMLTRTTSGMCEVSLEVGGKWVTVIRDNGDIISHIVEPLGIKHAIAKEKAK